jgi:hypothetical protein
MPTTNGRATTPEVAILARMLGNGDEGLPPEIARYVLTLRPSERDKARMHDLAQRNQAGELSAEERDELFAYAKAGTLMSLLQSQARRVLGVKRIARPTS